MSLSLQELVEHVWVLGLLQHPHVEESPPLVNKLSSFRAVPLNIIGVMTYYASSIPVPTVLRSSVYRSYCRAVGCDALEADKDLSEYTSLAEFFGRGIRQKLRPIEIDAPLVVPCDGIVVGAGPVGAYGSIEVKNQKYRIRDLMGAAEREPLAATSVAVADRKESGSRLWYVVMHLEPRHCHRFSSPGSWWLLERRHIPGFLLWLKPIIDSLYTENERVVLLGHWEHGMFAMTAVGAAGRGSIKMDVEDKAFRPYLLPRNQRISRKDYDSPKRLSAGEALGGFRLGSAIVLVFEAPEAGFSFDVKTGDEVKTGQRLATITAIEGTSKSIPKPPKLARYQGDEAPSRRRFRRAW